MKDVIAQKLAAGEGTQNIKNYFVQQYGPQVLGEPPMEGFNWLAWILPIAVVVGGGIFLWSRARRMVRTSRWRRCRRRAGEYGCCGPILTEAGTGTETI